MKYKYYRYNGGLAQIPDIKHGVSLRFILGGARQISWADYHNLIRKEQITTKGSFGLSEYGKFYERRNIEEIEAYSNIARTVEEIRMSFSKKLAWQNNHNRANPHLQKIYRLRRKQQLVDNFVEK